MAQSEPSTVSVTCGGEDGGVPARDVLYSSSVADDELYVTASSAMASSSHEFPCDDETAHRIEKSREQGWSELKDGDPAAAAAASSPPGQDALVCEELKIMQPCIFKDDYEVELGRLIAAGGQAHIYDATVRGDSDSDDEHHLGGKGVQNGGFSLADLQRLWPLTTKAPCERPHLLGENTFGQMLVCCKWIHTGTFLKDGRFALLMAKS